LLNVVSSGGGHKLRLMGQEELMGNGATGKRTERIPLLNKRERGKRKRKLRREGLKAVGPPAVHIRWANHRKRKRGLKGAKKVQKAK